MPPPDPEVAQALQRIGDAVTTMQRQTEATAEDVLQLRAQLMHGPQEEADRILADGRDWYPTADAAKVLGVTSRTVLNMLKDGRIEQGECRQAGVGRGYLVARTALVRFRPTKFTRSERFGEVR